MIKSHYGERIVLVDSGIAGTDGVTLSPDGGDVHYRIVGNIAEALYSAELANAVALVLMSVTERTVDAVIRCTRLLKNAVSEALPLMVVGPADSPYLRVQCFRAGAVDYVDAGSGRAEIDVRVRARLRSECNAPQTASMGLPAVERVSRRYEIYRLAVRYLASCEIGEMSKSVLASRIGVSTANLDLAFREVAGCSTSRFLRQRRIDCARTLLKSSSLSVTSIAEVLGFSDSANFATAFRQIVGQSPSRYRDARCEFASGSSLGVIES
ncbi:helix-turn-helix transcriptional regulator [Pandoraea bronchicola]|uniref:Response regulator n=1 Tax=Pandoraea bronchicola TaxID=2508287 RepID=A0A5E5C1K7_9BURK|nr:helix-turn-helix transcriptional regulator [Pandoraea bronchicola]VVE90510.1 Response regulator [Pandoraea bronchicola]